MPASERQRIRQKWVTGDMQPQGGWSVTALRLLPVLIGIGVVLLVTLRAYMLLQREVRRRERTERELESQLNFQQTMMEMVPYPLVAKDLQGRYLGVNRAYEQATGLKREAVIGRTSADVQAWGKGSGELLERLTRDVLDSGTATQIELEFEDWAGDIRHGLFCVCPCSGADGAPLCALGTLVDITDIRRAEKLAGETQRRLCRCDQLVAGGGVSTAPGSMAGTPSPTSAETPSICWVTTAPSRCSTTASISARFLRKTVRRSWVRSRILPSC